MVLNLALPYQDLTIMDACLATKTHYIDTANYEPEDTAKFEYSWQWAYRERFEKAGITALLGSGFDPGVTGGSTYAWRHEFGKSIINPVFWTATALRISVCRNFNRKSTSRRVSAKGLLLGDWSLGRQNLWKLRRIQFQRSGQKDIYLLHHGN